MRRTVRGLAVFAGFGVLVGGCAAASHIRQLQPPSVPATPFTAPAGCARVTEGASWRLNCGGETSPFQRGIDIDWYAYTGQPVQSDANATVTYLRKLHADAVSISFPFFMNGAKSDSVHATIATPTPGELATAVNVFERGGFYVSIRPLLDEKSLGRSRVGWVPGNEAAWFASYERFVKPYAVMARQTGVSEFIIGTELNGFNLSPRWAGLVRLMRGWYGGILACADNWDHVVTRGCGVTTQTIDAYHPAYTTRFLAAWEQWDATLPRGMVQTEVGIAAARGAWRTPWVLRRRVSRTNPATQAQWFTAACKAAVKTHLGGVYFWSVGLSATPPPDPTLAEQTNVGGPGAKAIAACYAWLERSGK